MNTDFIGCCILHMTKVSENSFKKIFTKRKENCPPTSIYRIKWCFFLSLLSLDGLTLLIRLLVLFLKNKKNRELYIAGELVGCEN